MLIYLYGLLAALFSCHAFLCWRQITYIGPSNNASPRTYAKARTYLTFLAYSLDILWCGLLFFSPLLTGALAITSLIVMRLLVRRLILGGGQFYLEKHFGFGHTRGKFFFLHTVKSLCLQILLISPIVAITFRVLPVSVSPLHFVGIWLIWFCLDTALVTLRPWIQSSLFDHLHKAKQLPIGQHLEHICHRIACPPIRLYIQDTSSCTSRANARMEGVGPFKRIVVQDTLLNQLEEDETLAVIAHELGHHTHHHILKYQSLKGGLALLSIWVFSHFSTSLAALVISAPALSALALPILNAYIRRCEFQADRFAATHGGGASLFLQALDKIHRHNATLPDGDPLYSAIYSGHPTPQARTQNLQESDNGSSKVHLARS